MKKSCFTLRAAWIACLALLLVCHARAQQPGAELSRITGVSAAQRIDGRLTALLEDKEGRMTVQQVHSAASGFKKNTTSIPNLGVSPSVFWIRVALENTSARSAYIFEVQNPMIDEVILFQADSSGAFSSDTVSKQYVFSHRRFKSQNPKFLLNLPPGQQKTIYLRVSGTTQLLLPMSIEESGTYIQDDASRDILSSVYFGIMLVMFLYNLFIYFTVRDLSYLYYILYILCVALVQLTVTGFGYKYIWSGFPWLERHAAVIFSSLTAYPTVAFVRRFLRTKAFAPRLHKGLWFFVVGYSIALVCTVAGSPYVAYNLINMMGLLISFYVIGTAAYIWKTEKYRPALFFLVSWSVFFSGVILFVLKDFGVLPYNLFTISVLQLGSGIETILLSFALADRINTLKKEKEASQAEALLAAQENERIVTEQNIVLDQKVKERTYALQQSNEDLGNALSDLKEAQSQLVEQEKMASLGQLTAGIAHEINNPINFVTSNVRPLRRDMDMLLDMLGKVEEIGLDGSGVEEKRKALNRLREEYDYDYLQEEINILLQGIQEGSTRTAEIVKGLRIFSRLDEDDLKKADMNEGLDSTIIIVNNLLNNKIEIIKNYRSLPLIECFPGKLNQVFLNMITNGIHAIKAKFGENNGGRITLSTHADEMHVYVTIADNGIGMDEQTRSKIFEPFFTTKDVGEGTGLGLSIAYNTVKKHNGTILLETKPDEGTAFTLQLPIIHELQMS